MRRTIDGVVFEGKLPATACKKCGESFIDAEPLERFELTVAAELGRLGLCSPEAFRFMRKALGHTGVSLAMLLDVKAETISRWENGARRVDRGAFTLLAAMASERLEGRTDTLDRLNALRRPRPAVKRVRVA